MKVGDYVRTKDGIIEKYSGTNDSEIENFTLNEIVKSSPNIIDLIEFGDYVNGYEVTSKDQFLGFGNHDWYMTNDEIKSIVTKEMFSSVEYRVEND